MTKSFLTLVLTLLLTPQLFSQADSFDKFVSDSLERYISNGMREWGIPGLSIGIIKDNKLVFNKGFGTKEVRTDNPVDTTSLFMIGSLSKALTAATVVAVAEKDSISLDDPVQKWIPSLRFKNDSNPASMLVEDILTGRTGLGGHKGDFLFWKTTLTNADLLKIMPHMPLETEVRRKFIYNNISYLLLDTILEQSTTKNWAAQVSEAIFQPLKMSDTYPYASLVPSTKKATLTSPHIKVDSAIVPIAQENIENMGPAGSIVSSSTDMSKWIMEFINGEGVLPTSVKKIIRKPYQLRGYRSKKDTPEQLRFLFSGMGWNIFDEFDQLTYTHDGGTDGFKAQLMIIPEAAYGVIVLTNSRAHDFAAALVDELHYALMGKEFQNFSQDYLKEYRANEKEEVERVAAMEALIVKNGRTPKDLKQYEGTYSNTMYGTMSVIPVNGQLELVLSRHQNNLKGTLASVGEHRFWVSFSSPEVAPTKIEFSKENNTIKGFQYFAETSGDTNYWFKKID